LGIYEDTGSFTFSSTTAEDYEAARFLLERGANLNTVADMLTRELTAEQVSLLNDLIHSARTHTINGIPVCIARASVDKYIGDFAMLAHKLMDMENLNVLFALARMEDRIYLVARSRVSEVNAGEIAAAFGGGGHPSAASAAIKDLTLSQVEDQLFRFLHNMVSPAHHAREIMSSPVITVGPELSLEEAANLLTRYNINAAPVVEEGKLVGILSRQVIDKGVYHGLEQAKVRDFMSTEFSTVGLDANIVEIQEHLVDRQQRLVPVMEGDGVVGVVTRKDLLNIMLKDATRVPAELYDSAHESDSKRRKNVANVMAEQLPRHICTLLQDLGKVAEGAGYKAFAVGGFIRDLLLRRPNLDIDIVVEGDGIEFAREFAARRDLRIRAHKKFGTAVLIFPDGFKIDVATARLEYYRYPAALPTVELSSLKLDLHRRDFTINTLAVDLNPGRFGVLIDFFGGQRDLKERTIRVLHNFSFVEDPTRVFRAIRFEQRFGFRIGKHTAKLIENTVRMKLPVKLSGGSEPCARPPRRVWPPPVRPPADHLRPRDGSAFGGDPGRARVAQPELSRKRLEQVAGLPPRPRGSAGCDRPGRGLPQIGVQSAPHRLDVGGEGQGRERRPAALPRTESEAERHLPYPGGTRCGVAAFHDGQDPAGRNATGHQPLLPKAQRGSTLPAR
jgi:tRNA nucleotidyltransferase (CCA-adding enzyme)